MNNIRSNILRICRAHAARYGRRGHEQIHRIVSAVASACTAILCRRTRKINGARLIRTSNHRRTTPGNRAAPPALRVCVCIYVTVRRDMITVHVCVLCTRDAARAALPATAVKVMLFLGAQSHRLSPRPSPHAADVDVVDSLRVQTTGTRK